MINKQTTIPKGWKLKKIKDLLDYERPDKYIVKNTNYSDSEKTPVLTANKSFILGYTGENFGICENVPAIIFDDFTTDSKYVDFPFKVKSSAIKILRNKNENANIKFVYELIKSIKFPVGNHKRYYISQYQDLDVLVPPLPEQNKIAEILSAVDEDIEKTEGIIKKTGELKKGLIQKLLAKGVNTKINNVCKINPKQIDPKKSPNQEFNYIDIASVKDYRVSEVKKFLGKDAPSRARREIIEDDIIISTVRPNLRGFTFVTDLFNHFLCSTGFCVLRCEKKIYSKYLYYIVFQDKFVRYLVDKTTGSNYPAVNSNIVGEYIFKLPSISEQKQIAEILSAVDDKINIYKQIKNKLTLLKKGLMQDLLNGMVRVEG